MAWPAGAVVVATLVVLAGLAGPAAAATSTDHRSPATVPDAPVAASNHTPPDPDADVLGWEDGYWHNESIAVDQSDGFTPAELNATVARGMARVEVIRGLEFERPVPVRLESRESYAAEQANDTASPALATFDNAKFEALFLVGETEDSIAVQNENAGAAILGFYSSRRDAIVLISENASTLELDELTLAHELTHALQDQHFNLSRYDARTRDGANAQSGLIEGDASLVERRYRQRCGEGGAWNGTCLEQSSGNGAGGGGELANIGTYLVKYQPYSDGPKFVTSLERTGGWDAVNAAYDNPPTSSEQVIHPERYPDDVPTSVALDDRATAGWERVRPPDRPDYGTVGEAGLAAMFVFPLYQSESRAIVSPNAWLNYTDDGTLSEFDPLMYGNRYVAGWDGDRLHVYVDEANETAYVWRLVWDSPADAQEFADGYAAVLDYWGGVERYPGVWVVEDGQFADAFHVAVEGDTVTIVNAPSVETLTEVRSGLAVTPTPTPTVSQPSPTDTAGPPATPAPSPSDTPTATPAITTSPGQPGFGVLAGVVALLLGLLGRRRR